MPCIAAAAAVALFVLAVALYVFFVRPPDSFPRGELFHIGPGESLNAIAERLAARDVIRSPFLFKAAVVAFGGPTSARSGDYAFAKPLNAVRAAWRISRGHERQTPVRVTIPEGTNVRELAALLLPLLPRIDREEFERIALPFEGYLFPDTYQFPPSADAKAVVEALRWNFERRVKEIEPVRAKFGRPLAEVIAMASLLEEEARTEGTRRVIAGILWKRLSLGMPLQVDAAFQYVNGKNTFQLTTEDLRADHPYNTYARKGLPPTPISNPGLAAIRAAITPIDTKWLYYLSDRGGEMHYAVTHDEHLTNKTLYLR